MSNAANRRGVCSSSEVVPPNPPGIGPHGSGAVNRRPAGGQSAASRRDNPEAWVSGGHEKFETPVEVVSDAAPIIRCPRCGRVACGCTAPPDTFIPVGGQTFAGSDPSNVGQNAATVSRAEYERVCGQRDRLMERLEADPERAAVAALDGLRKIWTEDDEQAMRILDWIGVARSDLDEQPLALVERVRILAVDLATRQGYTLEQAERLAPPAFGRAEA